MKTDSPDPPDPPVSPTELRDYAKALGWITVPEAVADRLYVLHNPRFPLRQLVIPMDTTVADYADAALIASQKLAELEALPLALVLAQVQSFREDTLSFRVVQSREDAATLPLRCARRCARSSATPRTPSSARWSSSGARWRPTGAARASWCWRCSSQMQRPSACGSTWIRRSTPRRTGRTCATAPTCRSPASYTPDASPG